MDLAGQAPSKAPQNLDEERLPPAKDSQESARRFVEAVPSNLALLSRHPTMGRRGRVHGMRELVTTDFPYIIPYRVRGSWRFCEYSRP
ncbi:MAG: type II toxin-antitoxin system RelE/ParE family toxin [Leptospirillia bacterium]